MNKASLKALIKSLIEEDEDKANTRGANIKNELVSLGRGYNTPFMELHSLSLVDKVNIAEFPLIDTMLQQLYMKDKPYVFKSIFDTTEDITFAPNTLKFNEDFLLYLKEHKEEDLIKVIASSNKEYLVFISPVFQVEYFWELTNEEIAEEEPEEGGEGEDEEAPAEDEEF